MDEGSGIKLSISAGRVVSTTTVGVGRSLGRPVSVRIGSVVLHSAAGVLAAAAGDWMPYVLSRVNVGTIEVTICATACCSATSGCDCVWLRSEGSGFAKL